MPTNPLEHAVALIKQGEVIEAQKVLDPIIEADPHNLHAWFWFVETRSRQRNKDTQSG
jgi:hypothetical protein